MISLELRKSGDVAIVSFADRSLDDRDLCTRVGGELLALVDEAQESKILLDMGTVEYMSSVMVGQLFIVSKRCKANHIALKMCRVSGIVGKVFNLVRLENFIELLADEQTAIAAFLAPTSSDDLENGDRAKRLRAGAEAGAADDQFALAQCLDEGRGTPQNFTEALNWYQSAADQGHADAQYHLGKSHAYGINVPQDYDEALKWYQKAAEQGHIEAQYAMGMSYNYGIGVEDDQALARNWYQKAAEQGHEHARKELEQFDGEST